MFVKFNSQWLIKNKHSSWLWKMVIEISSCLIPWVIITWFFRLSCFNRFKPIRLQTIVYDKIKKFCNIFCLQINQAAVSPIWMEFFRPMAVVVRAEFKCWGLFQRIQRFCLPWFGQLTNHSDVLLFVILMFQEILLPIEMATDKICNRFSWHIYKS